MLVGGDGKCFLVCAGTVMQGEVQLVNVLEYRRGGEFDVSVFVPRRDLDELVPQTTELVLELWRGLSDVKLANRF